MALQRFLRVIALTAVLGPGVLSGCAPKGVVDRDVVCAAYDSSYAESGFDVPVTLTGKATIDVDQQRVRGMIRAEFYPSGDIYFDFSSSMMFGSHSEDFFVSMKDDTLRIVDRERGEYFQGEEAAHFLRETLGMDFDVMETMRLAAGGRPRCERLESVSAQPGADGEMKYTGRSDGEPFEVVFGPGEGRLVRSHWPLADDRRRDRLSAEYRWSGASLDQLTMQLEVRAWRCRILSSD